MTTTRQCYLSACPHWRTGNECGTDIKCESQTAPVSGGTPSAQVAGSSSPDDGVTVCVTCGNWSGSRHDNDAICHITGSRTSRMGTCGDWMSNAPIKMYLGDSVYAERDGEDIILTTENGYPDDPRNRIVLEPAVWASLVSWVKYTVKK